jgi:quercetin dioxygenase-like cupin family protein
MPASDRNGAVAPVALSTSTTGPRRERIASARAPATASTHVFLEPFALAWFPFAHAGTPVAALGFDATTRSSGGGTAGGSSSSSHARLTRPPRKETAMQISRNGAETRRGESDRFTGAVYLDAVAEPSSGSRIGAASVHFAPGARTAWHTHPRGQTLWVIEGVGLCGRRGGSVEVIRAGDRVVFEPGEEHWHGATPTRFMTHLALQEADDEGSVVAWGAHVTDEEYGAAPGA